MECVSGGRKEGRVGGDPGGSLQSSAECGMCETLSPHALEHRLERFSQLTEAPAQG
jgi:hypothetical protein